MEKHTKKTVKINPNEDKEQAGCSSTAPVGRSTASVELDKTKIVTMKVSCRHGPKNCITDVSIDGIGIRLNASPIHSASNSELLKYLTRVLEVHRGNIVLYRGVRSRHKYVRVSTLTKHEVQERLKKEIETLYS